MKKEHTKNVAFFGYYPIMQRFFKTFNNRDTVDIKKFG